MLDATKLIPEEIVPLEVDRQDGAQPQRRQFLRRDRAGRRSIPATSCPGIDFTNDPLLQGRLFSYTDTQLMRLGGPNFHELEINRPRCPMQQLPARRHQAAGRCRPAASPTSRTASIPPARARARDRGFRTFAAQNSEDEQGDKLRIRPESFADHYSQARLFFRSMTEPEQRHIVSAFAFELGKVETVAIRTRMLGHLMIIDEALGTAVEQALGMEGEADDDHAGARPDRHGAVADAQPDQEGRSRRSRAARSACW